MKKLQKLKKYANTFYGYNINWVEENGEYIGYFVVNGYMMSVVLDGDFEITENGIRGGINMVSFGKTDENLKPEDIQAVLAFLEMHDSINFM